MTGASTGAISNGVINLSPDNQRVFAEAERVLRSGGKRSPSLSASSS